MPNIHKVRAARAAAGERSAQWIGKAKDTNWSATIAPTKVRESKS